MCVSKEEVLDMEDWNARTEAMEAYFDETAAKLREELDARLEALKASNEDWNAGMAAIQAHLDERIAKLRKECETRLEAPASSTIAAAPTKISEAAPSTGGTVLSLFYRWRGQLEHLGPLMTAWYQAAAAEAAAAGAATTTPGKTIQTTTAAGVATTTPGKTIHGGMQPALEHCCAPLIRGSDAYDV